MLNFFHTQDNCRIILSGDFIKLMEVVNFTEQRYNVKFRDVKHLKKILFHSKIIEPEYFPGDILTMNSVFKINIINTNNTFNFKLVYPVDSDISNYKLSVFTPFGVALLGRKTGETITYKTRKQRYSATILSLDYQSL